MVVEDSDAQENADSIVADSTDADTGDEEEDSTAAEGHVQAASGPSPSALVPSPCPVRVACGLAPFPSPAHGTHAAPAPFAAGAHDPDPSHVADDATTTSPSPGVPGDLSPSSRAPCLVHVHAGEAESLAVGSGIAVALVHACVAPALCLTIRVLCPCLVIRVPCPTTRAPYRARVLCRAHVPCQTTRVCQTAPAPVIREPYPVPFAAAAAQYAPSLVHEHASQEDLGGDGVAVGGVKEAVVVVVVDEPDRGACAWQDLALSLCRYQQTKAEDRAWYPCWVVVGTSFRHDPHRA